MEYSPIEKLLLFKDQRVYILLYYKNNVSATVLIIVAPSRAEMEACLRLLDSIVYKTDYLSITLYFAHQQRQQTIQIRQNILSIITLIEKEVIQKLADLQCKKNYVYKIYIFFKLSFHYYFINHPIIAIIISIQ